MIQFQTNHARHLQEKIVFQCTSTNIIPQVGEKIIFADANGIVSKAMRDQFEDKVKSWVVKDMYNVVEEDEIHKVINLTPIYE